MNLHVFLTSGAWLPVCLGLLFTFARGFQDSSTNVATVVSTRTLSPGYAFALCALFEFCGAMFLGSSVAVTVAHGLFGDVVSRGNGDILAVLSVAFFSALAWGLISWWRALPTSNTHALLGGLVGASCAMWGTRYLQNKMVFVIFAVLVASPLIGFSLSILITSLLKWTGGWFTTRMKPMAQGLHVLACLLVSSARGSIDTQLIFGVLLPVFGVAQMWAYRDPLDTHNATLVRFLVALAISLGVLVGGNRILKSLSVKFYRIREMQGLGAEMTSAGTILLCALGGFPASTTQVIAGSIIGAGVAKNPRAIRWYVAQEMVLSWVLAFPTVAILAYGLCVLVRRTVLL